MNIEIKTIGTVRTNPFRLEIVPAYRSGLRALADFKAVQVICWADRCASPDARSNLVEAKPYKKGPESLGVFATRSPARPNPILLSTAFVTGVDVDAGRVDLAYVDALDGTPVLDLKPYVPSLDRVESDVSPAWCAHWPQCVEASGDFDWAAEFNF